ncbi:pheromone receptor [Coprinopsis cinerea AmutBmut pab1-1]|nr:pheromone receptor [Coprinopsis cinerea AmutBmut pab1-1]
MTALHPEFAPVAIIACLSLLLPLPWHWRARNVATLSMIFWLFVSNLIYAVNALIWGDNVKIVAQVWCDITTKLIIGANFGLPAACFCISMHLEKVASLRNAQSSSVEQRRRRLIEAALCIGLPFAFMGLHFIVQGHRFDIIEGYGCRPHTYYSIPAIFIVWLPPLLASFGSLCYSAIALRHFVRRLTFAAHLNSSKSGLTTSRYMRLIAMAATQMIWAVTVTSYSLWFTSIAIPLRPWTNWEDVHSDFGRVDQFLDFFTPPHIKHSFYVLWWMVPISAFLFVAFFAFGKDAMDEYKKCFTWVKVNIFRIKPSDTSTKKPFSFVQFSSGKSPAILPISKPTLQGSTMTESTLTPFSPTQSSRLSLSTLRNSDEDCDFKPYQFALGKAIGSYTDLSVAEREPISTPSTAVGSSSLGHEKTSSFKFDFQLPPLSPPSPITPPPPNPRRLRPLMLGASRAEAPTSPRPLTYPSHEAAMRGLDAESQRQ